MTKKDMMVMNIQRYVALIATMLVLSACTESHVTSETDAQSTGSQGLAIPRQLLEVHAVDTNLLTVTVSMGDKAIEMTPNANRTQWMGDIRVPPGKQEQLSIKWYHDGLLVAGYDESVGPYTKDQTETIAPSSYITAGTGYDFDNDTYSNLEEIEEGFNPNSDASPGAPDLDVIIPWIAPTDAPTIDGLYDSIWNDAVYQGRDKNNLQIDNLMIDNGADRPDGVTEFKWGAMHDGNFLYMLIFAENVVGNTLQADSTKPWYDDALNLFIDGDNSKGSTYDGQNDYHLVMPFLKMLSASDASIGNSLLVDANGNLVQNPSVVFNNNGDLDLDSNGQIRVIRQNSTQEYVATRSLVANNSADSFAGGSRAYWGDNSAVPTVSPVEFANCKCDTGQHTYELKIKYSDLGIVRSKPFGLDLQLDNDIDGGDRDARYGWKHPSRSDGVDRDETWKDPSFMGTALLR